LHFAKLGGRVIITGRNAANLEETRQKCLSAEGVDTSQIVSVIGDVSKSSDCKTIIQKAVDSFGCLDVLVS